MQFFYYTDLYQSLVADKSTKIQAILLTDITPPYLNERQISFTKVKAVVKSIPELILIPGFYKNESKHARMGAKMQEPSQDMKKFMPTLVFGGL